MKWDTAKTMVPIPEINSTNQDIGIVFFGTSTDSALEAIDLMNQEGQEYDTLKLNAFPFNQDVENFISQHSTIIIIEQNRDAQMKTLIVNEMGTDPAKLLSVLNIDGMPITAQFIKQNIQSQLQTNNLKEQVQ